MEGKNAVFRITTKILNRARSSDGLCDARRNLCSGKLLDVKSVRLVIVGETLK